MLLEGQTEARSQALGDRARSVSSWMGAPSGRMVRCFEESAAGSWMGVFPTWSLVFLLFPSLRALLEISWDIFLVYEKTCNFGSDLRPGSGVLQEHQ